MGIKGDFGEGGVPRQGRADREKVPKGVIRGCEGIDSQLMA